MAQTLLGNVKGPKGDTGAQGPQGEQGPTGAQGPQGETGPANTAFITDAFSTSQAYNAGDYCIYNNTLYRFAEDKAAGEWDDSKVMSTLIGTELSGLNSSFVSVVNNLQNGWEENGECGYVKMGNALFLQISVRRGTATIGTVIATGFPAGYFAVIPNPNAGSSLGAVRLMNGQLDILLELENSDYLFINGVALKQS